MAHWATTAAVIVLVGALSVPAAGAAPPERRPPEDDSSRESASKRRAPEPSPKPPASAGLASARPWEVVLRTQRGCHVEGFVALSERLLGLKNSSQLMSVEVWGDSHEYAPFDRVMFHLRAPRATWVNLYWIGPAGHIIVPVRNVRIPANRDAVVDTGGYIVPPLGREQWVAIGTLEPVDVACGDEAAMLRAVDAITRLPHAIGRWEVWSKEHAPKLELPERPGRR